MWSVEMVCTWSTDFWTMACCSFLKWSPANRDHWLFLTWATEAEVREDEFPNFNYHHDLFSLALFINWVVTLLIKVNLNKKIFQRKLYLRISRNVSDYYTAELLNWRIFGWHCQEASSLPSLVHASCIGTMRCCQILTHIWHCNCIKNRKSGWSEYHVLSIIQLHLILVILWDVFNLIFTEEKKSSSGR